MQLTSMIAGAEGDERSSSQPVNKGTLASALRELQARRDAEQMRPSEPEEHQSERPVT
jgi:hypothetical protein